MATPRVPVNAGIREVLTRHDPLAAWVAVDSNPDRYQAASELAAAGLANMLGLGHAWTVIADSLDLEHPGLYQALRGGDPELERRIGLVAREIWDRHGLIHPRPPRIPRITQGPLPAPPPAAILLAEPDLLAGWLRKMEGVLDAEGSVPAAERPGTAALQSMLPEFLDAYAEGSGSQREQARIAFSRFRLCCHRLGGFAGQQHAGLDGPEPESALRRGLLAESLLDMQLDWRDELLLIQALKTRAAELELPYLESIEMAANRSSERTAEFLRNA